jgi:inner membrane protein
VYRKGHFGVSLLVFAPLGYALLRIGAVDDAVVAGLAMLSLSTLPDVDHRLPGVSHRGITHTLLFALVVGGCLGGLGYALDPTPATGVSRLAVLGFAVGTLGIVAHLVGDALTPMGIRPFWPLSGRSYSLRVTRADNAIANGALFALGIFATAASVWLAIVA